VLLSPFQVDTHRATGFAAASALAGGRLATDLRDTPVALSVITREFIDALNLTDLSEAARWSTNGVEAPDNGQQNFFNNPVYYLVRGTRTGRQQRNHFPQFNDGDSYNLERYDFGRGPNSILFGNGTLGGVSSATTKRAETHRAHQSLTTTVGSWENYRLTADLNRPLSPRAAVRTALLWADAGGWRQKDFDRRAAAFLTGTFRPWPQTELRLEGEVVHAARQAGFTNLNDQFSGWDGRSTYRTVRAGATFTAAEYAKGVGRYGGYYLHNPASGQEAIFNYQDTPVTLAGGASPTTPIGGYTSGALPAFNTPGGNLLYDVNVPARRFAAALAGSHFRVPTEEFTLSPDAPIIDQRFRDLQFTLHQRLGLLDLEVAGDANRARAFVNGEQNRGTADTRIDLNEVLPNGAANPHFLQPYGDGMYLRSYRTFDYTNLRAAAARAWSTRLGQFTAHVLGGVNLGRDTYDYRYLSLAQAPDHRNWGYEYVWIRRYWNESRRPIPDPGAGRIRYVDPVIGLDREIQARWIPDPTRTDTEAISTSNFRYLLAAVRAQLLRDRWIVLGAVRADAYYFHSRQQTRPGDYAPDWDGTTVNFKPDAPADYHALTFRPRDAGGAPVGPPVEAINRPRLGLDRDPRYAQDRFKDDYNAPALDGRQVTRSVGSVLHLTSWLSPSFNYAETFNPPTYITRIDGALLEPTVARGIDLGLRLVLWERRLDLNFVAYRNTEINGAIPSDGPGFFNQLYDANAIGDQSPWGRNIRGIAPIPMQYRDTRTRESRGYEIEITFNPTPALRFAASLGLPKVYESGLYPDVRAYIERNTDLFRQIARDAGVLIDAATNRATVDASLPLERRSPDAEGAAAAYNEIFDFRRNLVDGRRLSQDQPVLHAFGDYTIPSGPLRRLRLGCGLRYRGRQILGNRGADTIADPRDPTRAIDDPTVDAYTPVYSPEGYILTTATLGYTWRLRPRGELALNLVVHNVGNDRGPIYSSTAQVASLLRPRNNDYTSPARETVPRYYALKQPRNFSLALKWSY
jgi:outer membrane receptor protein involved in Fe transport